MLFICVAQVIGNWFFNIFSIPCYLINQDKVNYINHKNAIFFTDQAERHGFWPRLWLFFSPFLFPPKKKRRKGECIAKIEIKSHDFLLDLLYVNNIILPLSLKNKGKKRSVQKFNDYSDSWKLRYKNIEDYKTKLPLKFFMNGLTIMIGQLGLV